MRTEENINWILAGFQNFRHKQRKRFIALLLAFKLINEELPEFHRNPLCTYITKWANLTMLTLSKALL